MNRTILHHYITSWGLEIGAAESGARALEILRRASNQGHPFDLAILDMQMPEMDGLQLARAIKADPTLSAMHLIMLTSMGNQNAAVLKEAGFSAGLAKPVRQSQLFDCIVNVMADKLDITENNTGEQAINTIAAGRSGTTPDTDGTSTPGKKLRILVAEDNSVNQKVAVRMLEKLGYRADVAGNGAEAVDAILHIPYDIVFMDCQMPEMDGFEATAQIRRMTGSRKNTTIVAMTANALQGDKEKCFAAGMDDYLSKPIKQAELAAVIDRWPAITHAPDYKLSKATGTENLLDESVLLELHELANEDDPDFVEQLLTIFVRETPNRIAQIRRAAETHTPKKVSEIAHLLKGTCIQLGLIGMVNLCLRLEDLTGPHALEGKENIITELGQTFFETKELLESKYSSRKA